MCLYVSDLEMYILPGTAVSTVILDAPSVLGNTVALACYLIGEEIQTVEWLKDGSQIALGKGR